MSNILVDAFLWGGGGAGGTPGGWNFGAAGGAGGAAEGTLTANLNQSLTVVVGGGGGVNSSTSAAGGGGIANRSGSDNRYGSGGGGYSGVFTAATPSQANAVIMAGGGGGGGSSRAGTGNTGGAGGGTVGEDGVSPYDGKTAYRGRGGTQTAAGVDASCDSANASGFQAALLGGTARINGYGGAGGGGYWGGSAGGYSEANTMGGGAGGSGYFQPSIVSNAVLYSGAATTPGNSSNAYRSGAGAAGPVSTAGTNGRVVLRYPTAAGTATGGTITTEGAYTVHTFTSAGTFTVTAVNIGLSSSHPTHALWGDTITFFWLDTGRANGSTAPYTITGVTSAQISNAALSGNFTFNNSRAQVTVILSPQSTNIESVMVFSAGSTTFNINVSRILKATGGRQRTVIKNGIPYQVHTFTASGNFTTVNRGTVEYLVVAGGGGGGYGRTGNHAGGGGGAGGVTYVANVVVNPGQTYAVTVGAGAAAHFQGSGSSFGTLTSTTGGGLGGGGGGANGFPGGIGPTAGGNGGSGGGGSGSGNAGGLGIPGQGFNGAAGGAGGGAGAPGNLNTTGVGGAGGIGFQTNISGTATFYGGGGGGPGTTQGQGGAGGGGRGAKVDGTTAAADLASSGLPNTGGGGGAGHPVNGIVGGSGGSGVVIVSYPGPGIDVSSQDLAAGETLTVILATEGQADNTLIPYTITGVDSSDINGASLTGNFTIVNNLGTLNFLITTPSKKTLTFQSNGLTQIISLVENRFGLSVLSAPAPITFTSQALTVVDLTDVDFLTSISILQPNESAKFDLGTSSSVLLALRSFITIDFASRTSFNAVDVVDFDPPQYWIGA